MHKLTETTHLPRHFTTYNLTPPPFPAAKQEQTKRKTNTCCSYYSTKYRLWVSTIKVNYWRSSSWQHVKSYRYWQCKLVATSSCCPTWRPGHQHHDLISHSVTLSWHWANQFLTYSNNTKRQARKRQVAILMSLVWFDQGSNPRILDSPISQNGRRKLFLFGHPFLSGGNV